MTLPYPFIAMLEFYNFPIMAWSSNMLFLCNRMVTNIYSLPCYSFQLLERALEECGNDLDVSIKSLHELCLGHVKGNSSSVSDSDTNLEKGMCTSCVC